MKIKNWFIDFFKGSALGTGILPGVSVGTVGIILGIYKKLIGAINNLTKHFFQAVKTLIPIGLGCIFSAVILLVVQDTLYEIIPLEITCLFAGFVLCGIPVIYKDLECKNPCKSSIFSVILGFLIAAGIGVLSVVSKLYWKLDMSVAFELPSENLWIYPLTILVGFVAAVGCLLPGISGSMIIFIFGLYNPIIDLFKGDNSLIHNSDRLPEGLILILLLVIGIVAGLVGTSKAMDSLLKKHKQGTYTLVIGFILGSFVSMFVNQDIWGVYSTISLLHIVVGIVVCILSFVCFYLLIKFLYLKKDNKSK